MPIKVLFILLGFLSFLSAAGGKTREIQDFIILDVRTESEFTNKHLDDAQNVDFLKNDFKEKVNNLDKSKSYKIYCRSGNRSKKAVELMQSLGFKNLENLGSLEEAARTLEKSCLYGPDKSPDAKPSPC